MDLRSMRRWDLRTTQLRKVQVMTLDTTASKPEASYDQVTRQAREQRAALARELRAMADQLDALAADVFPTPVITASVWHVDTPTESDPWSYHTLKAGDARAIMAAMPGGWNKSYYGNSVEYSRQYCEGLRLEVNADRSSTCKRVKTGTRRVEATEAHDEDVFKWACDDSDSDESGD